MDKLVQHNYKTHNYKTFMELPDNPCGFVMSTFWKSYLLDKSGLQEWALITEEFNHQLVGDELVIYKTHTMLWTWSEVRGMMFMYSIGKPLQPLPPEVRAFIALHSF